MSAHYEVDNPSPNPRRLPPLRRSPNESQAIRPEGVQPPIAPPYAGSFTNVSCIFIKTKFILLPCLHTLILIV